MTAPLGTRTLGTIIVPTDPSRRPTAALATAGVLASAAGMAVEVVAATRPEDRLRAANLVRLARNAALAAGAPSAEWRLLVDPDVSRAILARAEEAGPEDLLCLATHARRPVVELGFGSVSEELLRRSPLPVVLVGPDAGPATSIRSITACVDGSEVSLAAAAAATRFGSRIGATVELIEAVDLDFVPEELTRTVEAADMFRAVRALDPAPRNYEVLHGGDPAKAILDHVGGDPSTMIAFGLHGRNLWASTEPGGVALTVVRGARGPVFVLPPSALAAVPARSA